MTQSNWIIRPATAADKSAILALINVIQPHIPWSAEHYDWQFARGPAGPAEIRVVECDDTLVSLYVGTRKPLWVDGKIESGIMVQDVLTHPSYRGKGMLNALATSFLSEMQERRECGYTFPNKLSENSFRRSGWNELMPVPALECNVVSQDSFGVSAIEVSAFDSSIDTIWPNAGIQIGVARNAQYLNWRYERPDTVYRKFVVPDVGFFILKSYDRGTQKVVHICDLILHEHARDQCRPILDSVKSLAAQSGASLLTCWVPPNHPYRQTFEDVGFVRDTKNDRFVFTTGPVALLPTLTNVSHWHFSQGDSDVY
jgi:hypothetical protein